jgi:hypothetical protein
LNSGDSVSKSFGDGDREWEISGDSGSEEIVQEVLGEIKGKISEYVEKSNSFDNPYKFDRWKCSTFHHLLDELGAVKNDVVMVCPSELEDYEWEFYTLNDHSELNAFELESGPYTFLTDMYNRLERNVEGHLLSYHLKVTRNQDLIDFIEDRDDFWGCVILEYLGDTLIFDILTLEKEENE